MKDLLVTEIYLQEGKHHGTCFEGHEDEPVHILVPWVEPDMEAIEDLIIQQTNEGPDLDYLKVDDYHINRSMERLDSGNSFSGTGLTNSLADWLGVIAKFRLFRPFVWFEITASGS